MNEIFSDLQNELRNSSNRIRDTFAEYERIEQAASPAHPEEDHEPDAP